MATLKITLTVPIGRELTEEEQAATGAEVLRAALGIIFDAAGQGRPDSLPMECMKLRQET